MEDERPFKADEAPVQTLRLRTVSKTEADDNDKAVDTQGGVALVEDERLFKANDAVVDALRTVFQMNNLVVRETDRGERTTTRPWKARVSTTARAATTRRMTLTRQNKPGRVLEWLLWMMWSQLKLMKL